MTNYSAPALWIHQDLQQAIDDILKKKTLDFIPAVCDGKVGFCLVSLPPEDILKIVGGSYPFDVITDSKNNMTAHILGTSILVDVRVIDRKE